MQKRAKSTILYTIVGNSIRRSLKFFDIDWSCIQCVWMCIQVIGADNNRSSVGSCRLTASRNDYILRTLKQNLNLKPATKIA